ncbi:hypothetical protein NFI96_026859 [Prochilodus magdalenae]|nr:hypothetical protein NFI96_026859 [Prochilodus magdalenae]
MSTKLLTKALSLRALSAICSWPERGRVTEQRSKVCIRCTWLHYSHRPGPSHPKLNEQELPAFHFPTTLCGAIAERSGRQTSLDLREFKRCGPFDPYINAKNYDNETPLHCAAQYGHSEVVRLLLEELTDPTMRNNRFETPLDLAALYGRLEVVKLLLCAHPNLLSCNMRKHTPLHLASRNGHLSVVEVLLTAGMDINYQTEKGSALHEAALFGKTDVVQKLLRAGIDVNIVDSKNLTALDIVREMPSQKSRQIAAFIQAHMSGHPPDQALPPPPPPPPQENLSPRRKGRSPTQQRCAASSAIVDTGRCPTETLPAAPHRTRCGNTTGLRAHKDAKAVQQDVWSDCPQETLPTRPLPLHRTSAHRTLPTVTTDPANDRCQLAQCLCPQDAAATGTLPTRTLPLTGTLPDWIQGLNASKDAVPH